MRSVILLILLSFGLGCSDLDNAITQYIVVREGRQLRPIAKVVYKVFVDRQEVVYWVEIPDQERSQLYRLKKCIVVDAKNWEGDPDPNCFSLPSTSRVEFVNGRFRYGDNVDWVTWHFKTNPKPSNLENILIWGVLSVIAAVILYQVIDFIKTMWLGRTRKEPK